MFDLIKHLFNFVAGEIIMALNDKQLQIIVTAEKLFSSRGYDGTTIRDIAEEAGINIAMISYYFGSKEKLMQALFEERTNLLKIRIESLLKDESITPLQKMNQLVDYYVEKVIGNQQFYKIMICEQMMDKSSVVTASINDLKRQNTDLISKIIDDGQKKGAFKKKVDVVLLINTMFGLVMQTLINKSYYRAYNKMEALPDVKYNQVLKDKLTEHIKNLFKAILSYEA